MKRERIVTDIAHYIDNTLLILDATENEINDFCKNSLKFSFASVCVNPCSVQYAVKALYNTDLAVCSVVGFPFGTSTTETKLFETVQAIKQGVKEIDAVINIGKLKDNDKFYIDFEIRKIVEACHQEGVLLKIIIETCLLSEDEKKRACEFVIKNGADFIKTSTGFSFGGATVNDVKIFSEFVKGTNVKVKASGGINSYLKYCAMIEAGAERIGTSHGIKIVEESIANS